MNIMEAIRHRRSVRTFQDRPLNPADLESISHYLASRQHLEGPFHSRTGLHYLPLSGLSGIGRVGTYGFISQAQGYLAGSCEPEESSLVDLGYILEKLILFLTMKGIGTCWLGGTFQRQKITRSLTLPPGHIIPAVTPVGYPQAQRLSERLIRQVVRGDHRLPWETLFSQADSGQPLIRGENGFWDEALEMLRLSPSASNKQPWRVMLQGDTAHLYLQPTPGYGRVLGFEMQRLDMGIAMCHLELTLLESGHNVRWERLEDAPLLAGAVYISSLRASQS